jgi:hypothetical protein
VKPVLVDVNTKSQPEELGSSPQALSIPEQVELQLDQKLAALDRAALSRPGQQYFN